MVSKDPFTHESIMPSPNNHHIQGYRNIPSRGCQEVDGYEPDMLTQKCCLFQAILLPTILALSPKWASASFPACPPAPL